MRCGHEATARKTKDDMIDLFINGALGVRIVVASPAPPGRFAKKLGWTRGNGSIGFRFLRFRRPGLRAEARGSPRGVICPGMPSRTRPCQTQLVPSSMPVHPARRRGVVAPWLVGGRWSSHHSVIHVQL